MSMIRAAAEAASVVSAGVVDVVALAVWRAIEAAVEALVMALVRLVGVP